MYYLKIRKILLFVPKGKSNAQVYKEYMREFPKILNSMRDFFRGNPERIIQHNRLNRLFDFLADMKEGKTQQIEDFRIHE